MRAVGKVGWWKDCRTLRERFPVIIGPCGGVDGLRGSPHNRIRVDRCVRLSHRPTLSRARGNSGAGGTTRPALNSRFATAHAGAKGATYKTQRLLLLGLRPAFFPRVFAGRLP